MCLGSSSGGWLQSDCQADSHRREARDFLRIEKRATACDRSAHAAREARDALDQVGQSTVSTLTRVATLDGRKLLWKF